MNRCRKPVIWLALAAALAVGLTAVVMAQPIDQKVYPSPGSTEVWPGVTLSVSFGQAMDKASVEAAVTIEPPAAGRFVWDQNANTVWYRPHEPLAPRTAYRVTIGTGARTARGTAVLTQPYAWSFTTAADSAELRFGYGVPLQYVTPSGKRGVPIQPGYPRLTVDCALYGLDMPAFAARYAKLPTDGSAARIDVDGLPRLAAWQAHLDASEAAARIALPDGTAPGLYVLDVQSARIKGAQTFLVYSDYGLVAKEGRVGRLAWLTRVPDGNLVPAGSVTLYDAAGQVLTTRPVDAEGLARFDDAAARFVTATVGEQTALVGLDTNWYSTGYYYYWWRGGYDWRPTPPELAAHIHTDRPIYRPGHTVHYKATLRRFTTDAFTMVDATTPLTVTVKDPSSNTVTTQNPTLDDFGSVAGDLLLGPEAPVGSWRIELATPGQTFTLYFQVQEYVKPDYEVTVETDRPFYITGDEATVAVQADYYFGQPVTDAEVTVRVYRGYYYYRSDNGTPAAELSGRTGPDGSFETKVRLYSENTYQWGEPYYFEAEVVDASRRPVVADAVARVYPAAFQLSIEADRYGVEVGRPVVYTVRTVAHDGQPVPGREVTVEVQQYWWDRERGSGYTVVQRQVVTTGADGSAEVRFDDLKEGWYQVHATTRDDAGRAIAANGYAWLYSSYRPWYWHGGLEVTADKDAYAAGDTARLLIKSPYTSTALVSIERDDVYDEIVVDVAGATMVEVPIKAEYVPNVVARVHLWHPSEDDYNQAEGTLESAQVNLVVPAVDRRLTVEIVPDAATHGPAEPATFTVRVRDAAGQPVDAQLSFALVDKAVLALATDQSGDIFDAFWSDRQDVVRTYDSLQPSRWYGGWFEDGAERGGLPPSPGAATPAPAAPGENKTQDEEAGQATPRREFPDTAYWDARVLTGPDGEAAITLTLPDSLTTWQALARAVTRDTRVGQGDAELVVTKAVIADLALPRFAVQGDEFALDVLGRNYVGGELQATTTLDAPGLYLIDPGDKELSLPFNETRFSRWSVVAAKNGENPVTAWVKTAEGDDGLELPLEIQPFAVPERFARAGSTETATGEDFEVPFNAVPEGSSVEVRLAPGMALGIIDGLEDLIGYPYGCVEQTMSRMLPNAVIARLVKLLGIEVPEIEAQLPDMMAVGLQKLYGFQNPNGSWGWWHWQYSEGNIYTTAYVLHGLTLTQAAGYEVDPGVLDRGFEWLQTNLSQEKDPRIQAYGAYVLALAGRPDAAVTVGLFDRLDELDAFALAALAIGLDEVGRGDLAGRVLDKLESMAVETLTTAFWPTDWSYKPWRYYYWYAMANDEKNTAMALDALALLRPESPVAPKAARWLMEHRWGRGWRTTQGTAFAVLGLTDYIITSGELAADYTWTVSLDGRQIATGTVTPQTVTERIEPIVIDGVDLTPGAHRLALAKEGRGTLFYTVVGRLALYYEGFAPTKADGLGIDLTRDYSAVIGRGGPDGWAVGDMVNVRLTLTTVEELHYVVIEDQLPAGFEGLNEQLDTETSRVPGQSRWPWRWWGYERKEVRDDRVTFFDTYLPPGTHTFEYAARVVTPGIFSARPAEAYTMYRPEVWGRSGSEQVAVAPDRVLDRPPLPGDYDRDCRLTEFDAALVADAWSAGRGRDVNGDGRTDVVDIATSGGRAGLGCGDNVPLPPGAAGEATLRLRAPANLTQGQTFDLAVLVTSGGNLGGYELTLQLPAGAFEVLGLAAGERLPGARVLGPVEGTEAVRIGGYAPTGTTAAGEAVLATLRLRALRAGDASLAVAEALLTTDTGGSYRVTADGVVVSPEPWAPRGTVLLPYAYR